jgi:hypothetical protein
VRKSTPPAQARITGSCGDGERRHQRRRYADCELLPVAFNRVPDSAGNVGSFVAVALRADQRPLIAYYDATNTSLKLYNCADAACVSGTGRTVDNSSDVGANVALAIRPSGLPVIAYRSVNLGSLRFYDCSNVACTTGTAAHRQYGHCRAGTGAGLGDGRPFWPIATTPISGCASTNATTSLAAPAQRSPIRAPMFPTAYRSRCAAMAGR